MLTYVEEKGVYIYTSFVMHAHVIVVFDNDVVETALDRLNLVFAARIWMHIFRFQCPFSHAQSTVIYQFRKCFELRTMRRSHMDLINCSRLTRM